MIRSVFALTGACAIVGTAVALTLSLSPTDEAVRSAAMQWLQVIDAGNYKEAALMISDYARGSRDWSDYLAAHRAPLGHVNKRQLIGVKHASTIPSDPVLRPHAIMRFKTSFERKAIAIEEVVVTKMGCCWEVSGYAVE